MKTNSIYKDGCIGYGNVSDKTSLSPFAVFISSSAFGISHPAKRKNTYHIYFLSVVEERKEDPLAWGYFQGSTGTAKMGCVSKFGLIAINIFVVVSLLQDYTCWYANNWFNKSLCFLNFYSYSNQVLFEAIFWSFLSYENQLQWNMETGEYTWWWLLYALFNDNWVRLFTSLFV